MNQLGHIDDPQDPTHVLYVSLLILGLDCAALERQLNTPVNQKSFHRINRKLGDEVLHFLFVCLDREKAGKIFRDCWPVLDKKRESQFYKAAFEWYKSLQQSYKQPVPTVMTKSLMSPGGPKFTSTLVTLARTALHTLITKRGPNRTVLNTPIHSRSPEQNRQTLRTLQAFKVAHSQNYIVQQKTCQNILFNLNIKARELCSKYRRLCKEGERASVEFFEALNNNGRLAQHQKDIFASASSGAIQRAVVGDISRMNDSVSKLWAQVDRYQQVEESAWKVLCPLLDGSTSLSHISGSIYSPQVPEMVYKAHANAINKLKLQGLYREGKLDLLSVVQYSNLALISLLETAGNTLSNTCAEPSDKIKAQAGQVTSLDETVSQLNDKLSTLLPAFNHSLSSSFLSTSGFPTLERIVSGGKPQLCPPTPPFTLLKKPVPLISANHVPLQLTPGVQPPSPRLAKDGFNATPRRLLCDLGMINASKKSPKANVMYSATTCKDDSITVSEPMKEDTTETGLSMDMVTVDLRGHYQRKKELALVSDGRRTCQKEKNADRSLSKRYFSEKKHLKQVKALVNVTTASRHLNMKELDKTEKREDTMKYNMDVAESTDNLLLDKLANGIAEEFNQHDGSGSKELLTTQAWKETDCKNSALEAGYVEMLKDSDTLLDAIRDMNITKKWENLGKSRDCSPHKNFKAESRQSAIQFQGKDPKLLVHMDAPDEQTCLQSGQQTQLGDTTITPKLFGCSNLTEGNTDDSQRYTFTSYEKAVEASPSNGQQSSVTSQERKGSAIRCKRRWIDSVPDLQERLHFVTQTPIKDGWSPLGTKIPSRFDGLDVSPGSKCFSPRLPSEIPYESSNLDSLRYHSKARLNFLLDLQEGSKSKPSSISYVENLKKSHASLTSEKKSFKTERNNKEKTSGNNNNNNNTECIVPDSCTNGYPVENVSKEYFENFTRMQSLLDLGEDTTVTNIKLKHAKNLVQDDEVFVSAREAGHLETRLRQSTFLPETSVFDTLIDSILGGELDVALLTDKNVGKQIRRESLSSRRQSVANMRRLSLESTKHLSEAPGFGSEDSSGILDENDSCLLSTSLEDV